jgi:spore maturation protein CgeB
LKDRAICFMQRHILSSAGLESTPDQVSSGARSGAEHLPAVRLCIVGDQTGTHIGGSLALAAMQMGWEVRVLASSDAWAGPAWVQRFYWHLMDRRPVRLRAFSNRVAKVCAEWSPDVLLTTGFAPVDRPTLKRAGSLGIFRLNYLTDDPWNPKSGSRWFRDALPDYDLVCSPRRSNLADLAGIGCGNLEYVPFGFGPELHFPEALSEEEAAKLACDVLFVGGADADRVPWIRALIDSGLSVGLYGNYWERFPETRNQARGSAEPALLRKATAAAKVAICLVRKANRDGHVMRTFEIPAVGACMLIEGTEEHREIYGKEGRTVLYFNDIPEMVTKAKGLVDNEPERLRLKMEAHRLIVEGGNTYAHRLRHMMSLVPRVQDRIRDGSTAHGLEGSRKKS